jgi:membrane protease YdiL (CAAX protease family)
MNKRSWMTTETTVQSEKLNEGVSHGSTEPPSGVAGGFLAMLEIALVATAGFILVPLVMALFGLSPHAIMNSSTSMVILLVSEATLTLLLIRFLMALRGEVPGKIGWSTTNLIREIGIGLLTVPVLFAATFSVKVGFQVFFPHWATVHNPLLELIKTDWDLGLFLFASIYAGGLKEEVQRAFVLTRFRDSLGGVYVGLFLWSLFFGYGHAIQGIDNAVGAGILGLFFGLLFIWRRNLTAPIVAHILYDVLTLIIYRFSMMPS